MRICFDIDGTICELKSYIGSYKNVKPLPGVVEYIKELKKEGHIIILYTARHMKTCSGNVGLVVAKKGGELFDWLRENEIEYDELYFGKPYADVYIDDCAVKFTGNWCDESLKKQIIKTSQAGSFKINLVITMAGAGSRFSKQGYILPKPLIPVLGKPMYLLATRSMPLHMVDQIIFVMKEGPHADMLEQSIYEEFQNFNFKVLKLPTLTRGQAETLYCARGVLKHNLPTLVHNADSAVEISEESLRLLQVSDGTLFTFTSDSPNYSYAKINDNGRVIDVKEKIVISNNASTGTYFFKSTVNMLRMIECSLTQNERVAGEFYIAPLYNKMIAAGQFVNILPVKHYYCFGTPAELAEVNSCQPEYLKTL